MEGRQWHPKRRRGRYADRNREHVPAALELPTPRPISDIFFVPFAEDIDPEERRLLRNDIPLLQVAQYPTEICRQATSPFVASWFPFLIYDASFLYALLFGLRTYQGWRTGADLAQSSPKPLVLWHKAVKSLRARVSNPVTAASDSTIASITSLATIASQSGDIGVAKSHLEGLKAIIAMRGGLDKLGGHGYVSMKACRVDIGTAMATGTKPQLYSSCSYDRYLGAETEDLTPDLGLKALFSYLDKRVINLWADLREFCRRTNGDEKLTPMEFATFMTNVTIRLLHLECSSNTPEEALRLGMLVFTSTHFLQFSGGWARSEVIVAKLKDALIRLQGRKTTSVLAKIAVWLHFMDAISSADDPIQVIDSEALRSGIEHAGARSWGETREILKGMIWVDALFDEPGCRVYNSLAVNCLGYQG